MRKILLLVPVFAAVVLAGCGGGGDDFFGNRNTIEGRWDGWVEAGNNPREQMVLDIRNDGSITGQETVDGDIANIDGWVENDGRFEMRSRLTNTQDVIYRGTMRVNNNDRLVGSGTATQGGTQVDLDFTLVREGF